MYSDTRRIRNNCVTVRLDDYEHALVLAVANYTGQPPAVVLREVVLREAEQVLVDRDLSIQALAA